MDFYYNKIESSYEGDDEEYKDNSKYKCQNLTFYEGKQLTLNDIEGKQRSNVILFVRPYHKDNKLQYDIQCFLFDELKEFIKNHPPMFIYRTGKDMDLGFEASVDESYPVLSMPNTGVHIECNYFMLLRYSTYLLYDPKTLPIGSVFGVSRIHGTRTKVYKVRPIRREFLSDPSILYSDENILDRGQDFSPGNKPPYPVKIIEEQNIIIERENSKNEPLIENIFKLSGELLISVFNDDKSNIIFKRKVKYNKIDGEYDTKRKYEDTFKRGERSFTSGDKTVSVKVDEEDEDYIIETTGGGGNEVIREHINSGKNKYEKIVMDAINAKNYETVISLIETNKIDPSFNDNFLLKYFVKIKPDYKMVELLLKDRRVDPTVQDSYVLRVSIDNHKILELLLKDQRVDPTFQDNYLLYQSVKKGYDKIVELLLKDGRVDPTWSNNFSLIESVNKGYDKIVELLLKDGRVDPTNMENLLEYAIDNEYTEVVKVLLEDPRIKIRDDLIEYVSENGLDEILEVLLKNPRIIVKNNSTALIKATIKGYDKVVKLLLEDGRIDPTLKNNYILDFASQKGYDKIVELLLKDERIEPLITSLQLASQNGHIEVVKLLLEDPRIKLHEYLVEYVSENNLYEILELLLKNQRLILEPNSQALMRAVNKGHDKVVKLLLEDGRIDPLLNIYGKTVWNRAKEKGYEQILDLLIKDGRLGSLSTLAKSVGGKVMGYFKR